MTYLPLRSFRRVPPATLLLLLLPLALTGCGGGGAGQAAPEAEAPPTAPLGGSTIAGSIRYDGDLPELRPLNMDADPACAAKHTEAVYPEILEVDEQAGLANVLVYVADNLPGGPYPLAEPPLIDQQGCRYTPHVAGIMVGQELEVLNSDELLHNVHSLSEVNRPFNRAMPGAIKRATFSFTDEEPAFRDQVRRPPVDVDLPGRVQPPLLRRHRRRRLVRDPRPAGRHLHDRGWHERLGTQRSAVTLLDGLTGMVDLTFALPGTAEAP